MISKEQLRTWLELDKQKQYAEKLENTIDKHIEENALRNITTFLISTRGKPKRYIDVEQWTYERTEFHEIWYTNDLSRKNRERVKEEVLEKYRENGFKVEVVELDPLYEAIKFTDIHKILEEEFL